VIALLLALALQDRDDPAAQLASFKLADGLEMNLFASEKDGVVKPIQMRWDERGRLWITCSPSYPQIGPGETADDRIVVVEDSDGDGRADRSHVFARGLTMPLGIEVGRGGAYVADGTELVHLADTDGDGRADSRRVILKGFYTGDSHQSINNFTWGPGGELLMCQGLHAYGHIETPWGVERLRQAGVWRLRERRLRLDAFLGEDMGPQNPYGLTFDEWGRPVLVAGNGQGVYDLLPSMIRTNHYLRFPQIWDKQGIKFGGADLVGGTHFPPEMQGLLVSGSFMNNSVYSFQLTDEGAGQRAKALPPIVTSTHSSFRPIDAKVGPDGAVYLVDWYNPVIGHYQASLRHPDRDKTHGRIWRITAKGRPTVKPPALATFDSPRLLEQLKSPERWTRQQAKRLLCERNPDEVLPALAAWTKDLRDERLLVEALGIHEAHERIDAALLDRALAATEPKARAYAAGVLGHWHDRVPGALNRLERAARDEHPRVRLAAVVAASYLPDPRAIEVAATVLDRPLDKFITYALTQAVHALRPVWRPAFDAGRLTFDGRAERLEFVLRADGSKDLAGSVNLLLQKNLPPKTRESLLALLARLGDAKDLKRVFDEAVTGGPRSLLEELVSAARSRGAVPEGDFSGPLALLASRGEPLGLVLAGPWNAKGLRPALLDAAKGHDERMRLAALGALADWKEAEALRGLADSDPAAAAALARVDLPSAAKAASRLLGSDPSGLVTAFLDRQGGSEALAAALEGVQVPADAAKLGLRTLSTLGRQDAALRGALWKAAGITTTAPEYSADLVKALAAEALQSGDPARGEAVFRGALTNCLSCHAIGGAGGRAGPDLAPVGTALPADVLIESVLWPNRQVKEGYGALLVMTSSDRLVQGYRMNEDKQALTLRDPQTDDVVTVRVQDIKARKEIGSIMPEGLANGLTRQELADLIRFLTELGKPGPFRASEKPLVRRWLASPAAGDEVPAGPWLARFAKVSGELPAEDVPASGWLRFEVEVLKAGAFRLSVEPKGIWVDGRPAAQPLSLEPGLRTITLRVEPKALGVLFEPATGSAGEARLRGLAAPGESR
jgi:putative heme-binding domain-containing protein